MKFGLSLPTHGDYGDIARLVDMAAQAEQSGWDGFFLWDHIARGVAPQVDPWIAITAAAAHTSRMRLGLLITPLSRRRPWKVAREIVSLDHLSGGRMVLGVGLGDFQKKEFENFDEVSDPRVRGERLDEALSVITGLQSGEVFSYPGVHFHVNKTVFRPKPVQRPYVPVWVAGAWPNRKPFRRAAQWQGVVPLFRGRNIRTPPSPQEFSEVREYVLANRASEAPFDLCVSAVYPEKGAGASLEDYKAAGATWWIEFTYSQTGTYKQNFEKVRRGPPG